MSRVFQVMFGGAKQAAKTLRSDRYHAEMRLASQKLECHLKKIHK